MSTTQSVPNTEFYEQFMNSLFEIHVDRFLIGCGRPDKQRVRPEAKMVVTTVMTVLCSVGLAFYLRFLVALCTGVQTPADLLPSSNATRVSRVRNSQH
jgi:hypothetical protein